jgi:signal transduction histidine kinase
MSSERFRERLFSGDQSAWGREGLATPPTERFNVPARAPLHRVMSDVPPPRSAGWNPQNWRLRTKLVTVALVPILLAIVLGVLRIVDSADRSRSAAIRDAVIISALVLLSVILLVVLAQSILKPLRVLRASAFDVADRRLPAAIDQLRTTEGRTRDIRIDPVPVYSREDVGQIARAFDAVHSEAVRLASEQAALRANVNDMFINLSRRSQGLVERQLGLIDELELGEQDSDRLAALFRLDHLATRMRRNGENLLVLAGAELRRRSGEPVPIVDVLRAAVSEIEEYQRIAIQPLPRAMVSGLAVNDIVHLVAEILDNATAYSSPESEVQLTAWFADEGGLTIEITDAGTGLRQIQVVTINDVLAAPPAVDVSVSRQMGLFVVGRLAHRHGIAVRLASPENAGVTVRVTLPKELVSTETTGGTGRSDYLDRVGSQVTAAETVASGADDLFHRPVPAPTPLENPPTVVEPVAARLDVIGELSSGSDSAETPIFHAMLSRWFTERQERSAAPEIAAPQPAEEPAMEADSGWETESDAGWRAAEVASQPVADEVTTAGLPKRRPQAFLVPGSAGPPTPTNGQPTSPPTRNAYAVRDRIASYQRGLYLGRHVRPVTTSNEVASDGDSQDNGTAEGFQ